MYLKTFLKLNGLFGYGLEILKASYTERAHRWRHDTLSVISYDKEYS